MRLAHFLRALASASAALLLTALAVAPAAAQTDYPTKPIRLVVGFGAGGGTDILARLVGAKLSEILGQSVVVENRPGAAARLAAEYVANQLGDGYTLLASPIGAMSIAAAIYPDLKYNPTKSFVPLALVGQFPLILAVRPDNPANTVKELVEFAKQHPDKANYPSTSPAFVIPMEELKLERISAGLNWDSPEDLDRRIWWGLIRILEGINAEAMLLGVTRARCGRR